MKPTRLFAGLLAVSLSLTAFATHADAAKPPANEVIKMATTSSTENSGLLQDILPKFEANSGYSVQVIAVGSGAGRQAASGYSQGAIR